MKKFSQKVLGMALSALVLAGTCAQIVSATEAAYPREPNGGAFLSTDFVGVRKYILRATANATQIVSDDQVLLYGICRMSSVIGDYVVAFDYTTSDTLTSLITGMSTAYDDYIMSPYVYTDEERTTNAYVFTQAESVRGCWWPKHPIRAEAGVVGKNNSENGYSLFFYRTDAGGNPY